MEGAHTEGAQIRKQCQPKMSAVPPTDGSGAQQPLGSSGQASSQGEDIYTTGGYSHVPQRRPWKSRRRPTRLQHLKSIQEDSDAVQARAVVDLAARVGELSLATGATTTESTNLILRITESAGVKVHANVTFTSVTLTQHRSVNDDPITDMRLVSERNTDYERLSQLVSLVDDLTEATITIDGARERFDEILDTPSTYQRWVLLVAAFSMGASVTALLGGNWVEMVVAGVATGLIDLVSSWMFRKGLSSFFITIFAAAIPTLIALLLMSTRSVGGIFGFYQVSPSLVVASGMVSLLAGLGIVTAARDAIDGHYITAGARTFEVAVLTTAIVLGLLSTLWLGLQLGVPAFLAPSSGYETLLVVKIVSSAAISMAFAIGGQLRFQWVLVCGGLGAVAYLGYSTMLLFGADTSSAAAGVGGIAVGFLAQVIARRWQIPVMALTSAGIIPLLPGLMLYRGIYALVEEQQSGVTANDGGSLLFLALLTALSLAAGSSFGNLLARPIPSRLLRGRRVTG